VATVKESPDSSRGHEGSHGDTTRIGLARTIIGHTTQSYY